jgi:hypothetical protein
MGLLVGDDAAHAAARLWRVAAVARDQVDVHVRDGLPGGFADVDADIEAIEPALAEQQILCLLQQGEQRVPLVCSGLEEVRDLRHGGAVIAKGARSAIHGGLP